MDQTPEEKKHDQAKGTYKVQAPAVKKGPEPKQASPFGKGGK